MVRGRSHDAFAHANFLVVDVLYRLNAAMAGLAIRSWCSEAIDCLLRRNQMALISAAFCQQGVVSMDIVFGHASRREAALEDFEKWAGLYAHNNLLAIVGHEPHLSSLVTWLISGKRESRIELKKGGACLVDFEAEARHDAGTLAWLLTPRQLKK